MTFHCQRRVVLRCCMPVPTATRQSDGRPSERLKCVVWQSVANSVSVALSVVHAAAHGGQMTSLWAWHTQCVHEVMVGPAADPIGCCNALWHNEYFRLSNDEVGERRRTKVQKLCAGCKPRRGLAMMVRRESYVPYYFVIAVLGGSRRNFVRRGAGLVLPRA